MINSSCRHSDKTQCPESIPATEIKGNRYPDSRCQSESGHHAANDTCARPNRRSELRVSIDNPCMIVPVMAEGFPDTQNISVGFALDISKKGIGFEIAGDNRIATNQVVFGLETDDGEMEFVSAIVRFIESQVASQRIGAEFLPEVQQLFTTANIRPNYDCKELKFRTGLSIDALRAWEDCGVLVGALNDKILVCPQCESLPTWRLGCPSCGASSTTSDQLIHHFACANIGHASEYKTDGSLRCPKCKFNDLVVGVDFEYLSGPQRCHNCGWSDSKLSPIGNCLSCGLRFAGHQALEIVINGYDVRRSDPLVYLP